MSYDTIICSIGSKYHDYNCNIVRTLFIDASDEQKQNYNLLYEAENAVISKLKPGATLKSVYEYAHNLIKTKKAALVNNLPPNFGFGIGLEFRENNLAINAKSERTVEAGMVFNVTMSFNKLQTRRGKSYAIMISDTVIVRG